MTTPTVATSPLGLDDLLSPIRRLLARFDRLLAGRRWLLVVVLLAAGISLLCAFPTYSQFHPGNKDWTAIERISRHPFDQAGLSTTDRSYNFTFRVTVPFLGRLFGATPAQYLMLQALAGLGLFAAVAVLVERHTASRRLAALAAIATGLTWAGASAFVETRGNFDVVAIALLAAAMVARRPPLVALCTFLACWTDERALPAVGLVFLYHHVAGGSELGLFRGLRQSLPLAAAAGLVAHVVSRVVVTQVFDVKNPSNLGFEYVKNQMNIFPVGLWTGLEGFWFLVALGVAVLWHVHQRWLALAFVAVMTVSAVSALAVVDVTRSMAYLFPAAFVGLAIGARYASRSLVRNVIYAAFVASAVWPLYYAGGERTVYWGFPAPLQALRYVLGIY